jgi:hypothetical protein
VVIENRSQPEGRAVMANPEIERAKLEFKESVIELGSKVFSPSEFQARRAWTDKTAKSPLRPEKR